MATTLQFGDEVIEAFRPTGSVYELFALGENGEPLRYIGSTFQGVQVRLAGHRSHFKRWREGKARTGCSSFRVLERPAFALRILEVHPEISEDELRKREAFHQAARPCVNTLRAVALPVVEVKRQFYLRHAERLREESKARYWRDREGRCARQAQRRREKRAGLTHDARSDLVDAPPAGGLGEGTANG